MPLKAIYFIQRFKRYILACLPLFSLLFFFQNCKDQGMTTAANAVSGSPTTAAAVVPAQDFSKAILDQPASMIQMAPGSELNESVVVDQTKLDSLSSQAGSVTFAWKDERTGKIFPGSGSVQVLNVSSADSGRYQLYADINGAYTPVSNVHFDLYVDSSYQVPANSLASPTMSASVISYNTTQQVLLIKVSQPNTGAIKTVSWQSSFGGAAPVAMAQFNDHKSIEFPVAKVQGSGTISALVSLEDGSSHTVQVAVPAATPANLVSCLALKNCPSLCTDNVVAPLSDNSGVKIQDCLVNGYALGEPTYICSAQGSSFSTVSQVCSCATGYHVVNGACVVPTPTLAVNTSTSTSTSSTTNSSTATGSVVSSVATTSSSSTSTNTSSVSTTTTPASSTSTSTTTSTATTSSAPVSLPPVPPPASGCPFNGKTVPEGSSVVAFKNATSATEDGCRYIDYPNQIPNTEDRFCMNGKLGGSFTNSSCFVTAAAAGTQSCTFNGKTILHGGSVSAFKSQTGTPTFAGGCYSQLEMRVCTNGVLSGSGAFDSCVTINGPADPSIPACNFNGLQVQNGNSVAVFFTGGIASNPTLYDDMDCLQGGKMGFISCDHANPHPLVAGIPEGFVSYQNQPFVTSCQRRSSLVSNKTCTAPNGSVIPFNTVIGYTTLFSGAAAFAGTYNKNNCFPSTAICNANGSLVPSINNMGNVNAYYQNDTGPASIYSSATTNGFSVAASCQCPAGLISDTHFCLNPSEYLYYNPGVVGACSVSSSSSTSLQIPLGQLSVSACKSSCEAQPSPSGKNFCQLNGATIEVITGSAQPPASGKCEYVFVGQKSSVAAPLTPSSLPRTTFSASTDQNSCKQMCYYQSVTTGTVASPTINQCFIGGVMFQVFVSSGTIAI